MSKKKKPRLLNEDEESATDSSDGEEAADNIDVEEVSLATVGVVLFLSQSLKLLLTILYFKFLYTAFAQHL